jgi:hypothetical protein
MFNIHQHERLTYIVSAGPRYQIAESGEQVERDAEQQRTSCRIPGLIQARSGLSRQICKALDHLRARLRQCSTGCRRSGTRVGRLQVSTLTVTNASSADIPWAIWQPGEAGSQEINQDLAMNVSWALLHLQRPAAWAQKVRKCESAGMSPEQSQLDVQHILASLSSRSSTGSDLRCRPGMIWTRTWTL